MNDEGNAYEIGDGETIDVTQALRDVLAERVRQNAKWGEQNHEDPIWLAILTEEVGEASEAILHSKFGGHAAGKTREELVHACAVALQWIECLDRARGVQ